MRMQVIRRLHLSRRAIVLLLLGAAAALLLGSDGSHLRFKRIGVPVPLPVYTIEGHSGSHQFSLLNLPVPQPGVAGVPVPVDVDGDLLPDITVAINLVQTQQVIANPPSVTNIIVPNLDISRLATAVVLGQASPPLTIEARLTLKDVGGNSGDTIVKVGYETGPGGSIPTHFNAGLGGLQNFFNPLRVDVNTGPALKDSPATYEGPLKVLADIDQGGGTTSLGFHFNPFPHAITLTYGTDAAGKHITYAHDAPGQVDLVASLNSKAANGDLTSFTGSVDRLPHSLALDLGPTVDQHKGSIEYRSSADGRLPDVGVNLALRPAGQRPTLVDAQIESLPTRMHADWTLPEGDGDTAANFNADGQGVGAIQADVRNYEGATPAPLQHVPTEQQFLNYQQRTPAHATQGDDRHISMRTERIRNLDFHQNGDGFNANVDVGDGVLPLQTHFSTDDRVTGGRLIDASATVAPLPDHIGLTMQAPVAATAGSPGAPLKFIYDSTQSVDIDAHAEIRDAAAGNAPCGADNLICGNFAARHIPAHLETRVLRDDLGLHVDIDSTPRAGALQPDFIVDATAGFSGRPYVAHAELLGYPQFVRILAGSGATNGSPARIEFHACDFDFAADACPKDSGGNPIEGHIGAVRFNIHNWLTRPADLPFVQPEADNFATIGAKGHGPDITKDVDFEANGQITDISEVSFRQLGPIYGVRTRVGGNKGLSAKVVAFGLPKDTDTFDVNANVLIPKLPNEMSLCISKGDDDYPDGNPNTFLAPCQNKTPFKDKDPFNDSTPLKKMPLALAYRASAPFNANATFKAVQHPASGPADDSTYAATANITNIPKNISVYVQKAPAGTEGPLRILYDTPDADNTANATAPLGLFANVQVTDADLTCADPRNPAVDKKSLCFTGTLENLPSTAGILFDSRVAGTPVNPGDPPLPDHNLKIVTTRAQGDTVAMNIKGIELAYVAHDDKKPKVILATGEIIGLPKSVIGDIDTPDTIAFTADPPLASVSATVQNFIGPDPLPKDIPDARCSHDASSALCNLPVPAAAEQASFVERGSLFRGTVTNITDVEGFSYATERAAPAHAGDKPTPLDTKNIAVKFGKNKTIRAYADLIKPEDDDHPDGPQSHLLADVTLANVPAGIDLCFRSEKNPDTADLEPQHPTYCDNAPTDKEGAFSFLGSPDVNQAVVKPSIYGFVRYLTESTQKLYTGAVTVVDAPLVVQGVFEGKDHFDMGGFSAVNAQGVGTTRTGIPRIDADFATFDLNADSGYVAPYPWGTSKDGTVEAFGPRPVTQYAKAVITDDDMRIRAQLGDDSQTGRLERVFLDNKPCPKPPSGHPDYEKLFKFDSDGNPIDYDKSADYKCIRAEFDSGHAAPFAVDVRLHKDGKDVRFRNGGLSAIPQYVQILLAKDAAPYLNSLGEPDKTITDGPFRKVCGYNTDAQTEKNCMPPLLRIDTPGGTQLSGVFELGSADALQTLTDQPVPANLTLDLNKAPNDWTETGWAGQEGIRAKINIGNVTVNNQPVDKTAVRANLKLTIPASITVDPIQKWEDPNKLPADQIGKDSQDMTFHLVMRDSDGAVHKTAVGQAAAFIHKFDDGSGYIVSGFNPDDPDNTTLGFPVPGELGFAMYKRELTVPDDYPTKSRAASTLVLDARTSIDLTMRAVLLHADPKPGDEPSPDIVLGVIKMPKNDDNDAPDRPSFRLRMENASDKGGPKDSGFQATETHADVRVATISAVLNLNTTGVQAHRVDLLVEQTENLGLEGRAFRSIDASPDGVQQPGDAPIGVAARVDMTKMNIEFQLHVIIITVDIKLDATMVAQANFMSVKEFRLQQKATHVKLEETGTPDDPNAPKSYLQVDLSINSLSGYALLLIIPLYGVTFGPPSPPPAILTYYFCSSDDGVPTSDPNRLEINNKGDQVSTLDRSALFIQPLEPRVFSFGIAAPPGVPDPILAAAGQGLCAQGVSDLLMTGNPNFTHPALPFDQVVNHQVPSFPEHVPPIAPPLPPPAPPPDKTVTGHELICGTLNVNHLTIEAGGSLDIKPGCNQPDANVLNIHAFSDVTVDGDLGTTSNIGVITLQGDHDMTIGAGGRLDALVRTSVANDLHINGHVGAFSGTTREEEIFARGAFVVASGAEIAGSHDGAELGAGGDMTIDGTVQANGAQTTAFGPDSTGFSGGSHLTLGGNGGNFTDGGTAGAVFGSSTLDYGQLPIANGPSDPSHANEPVCRVDNGCVINTEPGNPGAGPGAGAGGGVLRIQARVLTINANGALTADGTDGTTDSTGDCQVGRPPEPNEMNPPPYAPNTGKSGSGGGAGGAIAIGAKEVLAFGQLSANGGAGGDGKAGGGGGGAGGVVKIVAPIASAATVNGGAGGHYLCTGEQPPAPVGTDGGSGQPGLRPSITIPGSNVATEPPRFWFSITGTGGPRTPIPVDAAVPTLPRSEYAIVVCAAYRSLDDGLTSAENHDPSYGLKLPQRGGFIGTLHQDPCGQTHDTFFDPPQHPEEFQGVKYRILASTIVHGPGGLTPAGFTIPAGLGGDTGDLANAGEGFMGLWTTVVWNPSFPPNAPDCLDDPTFKNCAFQPQPVIFDRIIGVDNTPPDVNASGPATTGGQVVPITVSGEDAMLRGTPPFIAGVAHNLSGFDSINCYTSDPAGGAAPIACSIGTQGVKLEPAGSGDRKVWVVATDRAGNFTTRIVDVVVDTTPPASTVTETPATPNGNNGWYKTPPTFKIGGFNDPLDGGVSSGPAAKPFEWWFDSGPHTFCGDGIAQPPVLTCDVADPFTTGKHTLHWRAIDKQGNIERGGDPDPGNTLEFRVDTKPPVAQLFTIPRTPNGAAGWFISPVLVVVNGYDEPGGSGVAETNATFISVDGATPVVANAPIAIGEGAHTVCAFAVDQAGNQSLSDCKPVNVDTRIPVVTLTTPSIDGQNDWYVTSPQVTLTTTDATPGSGIDQTVVSVDGAPFIPYGGPFSIPAGLHEVRAYAVDKAGNQSLLAERPFAVDLSHPTSTIRSMPADPAQAGWFRRNPTVVLRATDGWENAGVDHIEYALNGGVWTAYTGPFVLPDGTFSVAYRSLDRSGPANTEPARSVVRATDITPPTAIALSANPSVWLRLYLKIGLLGKVILTISGAQQTQLQWAVSDTQSTHIKATVLVYNALGEVVRRLEAGTFPVTPGQVVYGSVPWDGQDQQLTGLLPLGVYHYRVVATDDAGNAAQSGESKPITIRLL
jgi:hypothetical protein